MGLNCLVGGRDKIPMLLRHGCKMDKQLKHFNKSNNNKMKERLVNLQIIILYLRNLKTLCFIFFIKEKF